MSSEVVAALIAGFVSVIGFVLTFFLTRHTLFRELNQKEQQWQESFRAELRRDLIRESTLKILDYRLRNYGELWKTLQKFSGFNLRRDQNPKQSVSQVASELNELTYNVTGLVMTDRSRRLLTYLLSGCSSYLKEECALDEIHFRSHLLKHSLRSDVGIEDYEFENEMKEISQKVGRVDDWAP